jgi:hypothetical protein
VRRFDISVDVSDAELMRQANEALQVLAEPSHRVAERLHVMGLDVEIRVEVVQRPQPERKA